MMNANFFGVAVKGFLAKRIHTAWDEPVLYLADDEIDANRK